jgi:hypothetical protein
VVHGVARRGASSATVLLVLGLAAGACSSPSSSSSSSAGGAPTSSTGAGASTTSTTGATTTSCPAGSLVGSVVGSSGAAGTIELTVELRSTATTTCVLGGYPGLQLLDASGAQLPTHVVRGGSYPFTSFAPTTVSLAPGAVSYFNLGYSDVPNGTETVCPRASSMWVTPPNAYDHLTLAATLAPCAGGTVTVSPVFGPGSAATQTTAP